MLRLLANILNRIADTAPRPANSKGEHAPIYESLAMTEELREALFPTTPKMVSAIFERAAPFRSQPPAAAPSAPPEADPYPIV